MAVTIITPDRHALLLISQDLKKRLESFMCLVSQITHDHDESVQIMKKRVLMLGWEYPPIINGGLGIACQGLARALCSHVELTLYLPVSANQRDGQIKLIDLESHSNNLNEQLQTLSNIIQIPADLAPYQQETHRGTIDKNELYGSDLRKKVLRYTKQATSLAQNHDFDLIHAHDWMTFFAGLEIQQLSGKPLVLHIHSLQYDRAGPLFKDWIYQAEQKAMQVADLVITVSSYTAQIAHQHYGIEKSKLKPIHNGAEALEPFRASKPFREKLVLFLGRLTAQKGPELFLDIASKVLEQTPDVTFVMAGQGEKLSGLIQYGAYHNLGDRLHFTGFLNRDEIHQLLAKTDVYCMPSVSEPFGLSALEAAQFGIPAVISRQSGVSEVLQQARKADYWDTQAMAEHITELVTNPEAHALASKASFEDAVACTWKRAANEVLRQYAELV